MKTKKQKIFAIGIGGAIVAGLIDHWKRKKEKKKNTSFLFSLKGILLGTLFVALFFGFSNAVPDGKILRANFLTSAFDGGSGSGVLDPAYKKPFQNDLVQTKSNNSVGEVRRMLYNNILPLFKYIFLFITLLSWSTYIIALIIASGEEEKISENKKNMGFGIIGFLIISLAVEFGDVLTPLQNGKDIINISGTQTMIQKIITYGQLMLAVVAIAVIFYGGIRFIRANGEDEEIESGKKTLQWGFLGLILVMVADPLVNTVFYPGPDAQLGGKEVSNLAIQFAGFLKFFLMFLGALAVISFIISGVLYIISFGDEERQTLAKRIMVSTLVGIIIIVTAFPVVKFFAPA